MQKMPKAGAYPVTLFQRFQMRSLRWRTPDLGVSVDKGTSDTGEVRQLQRGTSSDKSRVSGEDGDDE